MIFEPANSVNTMYATLTIMLTISASSADCEWESSAIRFEKIYLRTRLNNDTLDIFLRIPVDGITFDYFTPNSQVD